MKGFRIRRRDTPKRDVHPLAINTGINESGAGKFEWYSLHGAVYRIFAGLHPLHNPWGCLCVLSAAALSGRMSVERMVNTNREIAPQACFCNFEFSRCVPVGEETKGDAQVDDGLTRIE